jgi:general L-amino acid transport system permease protein
MSSPLIKPPRIQSGVFGWMQQNLFNSISNSLISILILGLMLWWLPSAFHWFIGGAIFRADNAACRALEGSAACWGVITEKYRLILFGRYTFDEQWRPLIASIILVVMLVISCRKQFWNRWLVAIWLVGLAIYFSLMMGFTGSTTLPTIESALWGGLPLTLLLSIFGIGLSIPLAILLALGRQSPMPIIRSICVIYIEFIRGIPLISVLFLASFMFPLFAPQGLSIPAMIRVLIGITLFSAAYLAEVIRGGLQALPKGQIEAAQAMGLSYWQSMRLIILPQAFRIVVPPLVNSFIASFKDTSLVTIVSLYELLGSMKLAFGDAQWRAFHIEGYLFIAAIYFAFCFTMSRYSQFLEKDLNKGHHP